MKKISGILVAALLAFYAPSLRAELPEEARQALRMATADIQTALQKSGIPNDQTIAILPVKGDTTGYVIGILKNAATGAGLQCVEGREDPFVAEVFKEVEWDERKDDILDAETLAKFGKLKAAKFLMYGFVREASANQGRGFAELEVHISSIETKRHIWGGVFAKRFYDPKIPSGPVDLSPEMRAAVRDSFSHVSGSLKSSVKLASIKTILIVPLAGDIDQYMTGLLENTMVSTPFSPKRLDVATLAEARALLRDDPKAADAIVYGAVRDLSRRQMNEFPDHTDYQTDTSIQLWIQKASSGEILWSDTVETGFKDSITMTTWEMICKHGPTVLLHKNIIIYPLVAFFALIVLALFIRSMRRAR